MLTAYTELNSGANWQKMQQKRICISASEKHESTRKSGISNIGSRVKHLLGWAATEPPFQHPGSGLLLSDIY